MVNDTEDVVLQYLNIEVEPPAATQILMDQA